MKYTFEGSNTLFDTAEEALLASADSIENRRKQLINAFIDKHTGMDIDEDNNAYPVTLQADHQTVFEFITQYLDIKPIDKVITLWEQKDMP